MTVDEERIKVTNRVNALSKDMKDKTARIIKLETEMFESKNFIKMTERHKYSINELLQKNMIGYQDAMAKMDRTLKHVGDQLSLLKKDHEQDVTNLATDINNAKEPLKHVLERATIENNMVLQELERTQKNNRTLIDDYLKNMSEGQPTQSQVNLFCSMSQDDLSTSKYMMKSHHNLPRVTSVLTTSAGGDDVTSMNDIIFRNTVSSFQGYKNDFKSKASVGSKLRKLTSQEVKSVTRGSDRYAPGYIFKNNEFLEANDEIQEGMIF